MLHASGAFIGMLIGAVLLIMFADVAPRVVIGLLALILVGLVLANSSGYTAVIQKLTGQKTTSN